MLTPQSIGALPAPRGILHTLSAPLLSSHSRQWNGIVVELRRDRDTDVVVPYRDHAIAVILAGGATLYQCRNARSSLRTVQAGDVIVTPAGEPKRWQHTEEIVGIVLRLAPAYLEKVAAEHAGEAESARLQDNFGTRDAHVEGIALRLLRAVAAEDTATRIYVESLTTQLSLHLLRRYTESEKPGTKKLSAALSQHKVRRAVEHIEAHLGEDLTLCDIARELAMSPGHFAHAFRQTVGIPPHQYVVNRRIERAKSLLRDSDMPISHIAQRIGCSNPSCFSFLFRRATGVTPGGYRKSRTRPPDGNARG
jgi:AraC family transcriptional regulator